MAGKTAYTAVTRIKMGGKLYLPGESIELDADEAKRMGTAVKAAAPVKGPVAKRATGRTASPNDAGGSGADDGAGNGTDDGGDPLDGMQFASPQARLRAQEENLTAETFKHQRKESENGFTVADVERIAEKKGTPDA